MQDYDVEMLPEIDRCFNQSLTFADRLSYVTASGGASSGRQRSPRTLRS